MHKVIFRWLSQRSELSTLLVATFVALFSGVYINILTGLISDKKKPDLFAVIKGMGSWNLLILASALLLVLQYELSIRARRRLAVGSDEIIEEILEAASKSLIFPSMNKHIRAIVTLRVGNTGRRVTRYEYNTRPDPERVASFPLDFGTTGRAYQTRSTVVSELPIGHPHILDEQVQALVLPDLRTVMAAPLLHSKNVNDEPLGVLAFDSVLPPAKLYFDRAEARQLAQCWADIIAKLLIVKEG